MAVCLPTFAMKLINVKVTQISLSVLHTKLYSIKIMTSRNSNGEKSSCIFCNIVNKLENTEILYDDDDVCVFRDIKPASDYHILTVPKRHIEDAKNLQAADKELGMFFINCISYF